MNLAGVALALGAALCWGVSDLGGGIASRRSTPLATLVVSQSAAIVLALAVVAISNERYPGLGPLSWAIVSGVAGFIALTCFYRALATGAMGLAAAVTGVIGAGIPVVAGIVVSLVWAVAATALAYLLFMRRDFTDLAYDGSGRRAPG